MSRTQPPRRRTYPLHVELGPAQLLPAEMLEALLFRGAAELADVGEDVGHQRAAADLVIGHLAAGRANSQSTAGRTDGPGRGGGGRQKSREESLLHTK